MDPALRKAIARRTPKINPLIAEGLAVKEMCHVEQYVDSIIRYAEQDFPEGLRYVDYRRLTPVEEYIKTTEQRNSRSQFDIARSDVYMIQLNFEFKGQKVTKALYLPYVRPGAMIALRGSTFAVSPVLADKGISLGTEGAFVQIPRAKLTFERVRHLFIADDQRRGPNVVCSWIHNVSRKAKRRGAGPKVKMKTSLAHYLFAKYGVKETFRLFCDTNIVIGRDDEITKDNYPRSKWVICRSLQRPPRGIGARAGKFYRPSRVCIAIREPDYEVATEALAAGFFYVVDHFASRIEAEFLDGSVNEIRLWRILLGHITGGVTGGEGSIKEAMDDHIKSLDSYIDAGAKATLRQGEIYVDDFYELLYYIIEILSQPVVQTSDNIATMYDKQLVVLRYVLRNVNNGIFRMLFTLNRFASKKDLTRDKVADVLRITPKTDEVLQMSNGSDHGEINSISLPGDNMFFKVTSQLVPQEDSGGSMSHSKGPKIGQSKFLHASIAEVGSYAVLPGSHPTGRARISPWVEIDDKGIIKRDQNRAELIDKTQNSIRRRD